MSSTTTTTSKQTSQHMSYHDPCPGLSATVSPRTPPTPARNALPTPPDSIQKYSLDLRRAMTERFEKVAQAGLNHKPPSDPSTDVEYGFDENPFDTHARLLSSFSEASSSSSSKQRSPPHPRRPKRVLDLNDDDVVLDSPLPSPRHSTHTYSRPMSPSTQPYSRPMSRASSISSPSSEMSFEVARSSDYISLYGQSRRRTPPVGTPSLLGASLKPLTSLTPSPQPKRSRRSRNEEWDEQILARTTSETMLLAAGLASQRGRRCRV